MHKRARQRDRESKTCIIKRCETSPKAEGPRRNHRESSPTTTYANHRCVLKTYHPNTAGTPSVTIVSKIACQRASTEPEKKNARRVLKRTVAKSPIVSANRPSVASCSESKKLSYAVTSRRRRSRIAIVSFEGAGSARRSRTNECMNIRHAEPE